MTSTDVDGLSVGAYPAREDPRDALCGRVELRPGMRVGTASVRRRAQLLALEPTLSIEPLRGNIDTRLRKRGERGLDAVVLAACGLDRLGLAREIGHRFEPDERAARGRTGSAGAPGSGGRGGARRRAPTTPTRAGASRPSAHAWPRSAAAALPRRRVPRRGAAHRPRGGRGRTLGRAAHRRRPAGAGSAEELADAHRRHTS